MKNFYSIEKGQLIVMWVFGLIGSIISLAGGSDNESPLLILLSLIIIFFLFFYTIGWKKQNKKLTQELKNSLGETVEKNKTTLKKVLIFLKKRTPVFIILLVIIIVVIIISNNQKDDSLSLEMPEKITCVGDINDLIFVENNYKTYNSDDKDYWGGVSENLIKMNGLLKNNSTLCSVSNVTIKVIIQDKNDINKKQEEIVYFFPTYSYKKIYPQQTEQYNIDVEAFDTFIIKHESYGLVDSTSLRKNIDISTQIISANWSK